MDGVIIETTGLTDPKPAAQIFFTKADMRHMYFLSRIVTVVDAKHTLQHLDIPGIIGCHSETFRQILMADTVLLNKVDLVPKEEDLKEIESRIKSIHETDVPITRCEQSKVDPSILYGPP